MSKYLLPCKCGKKIPIDLSQAGQQIPCECGTIVEVPTLRGVRELERSEAPVSASESRTEWDPTRGMIFAVSLLLFVTGAAVAYFGYQGLRATPDISNEVEQEEFASAVDDMTVVETYEVWQSIRDSGLGPRGQNVYVNIRKFRSGRKRTLAIGIAMCVIGVVGAIGANVGQSRRSS